MNIKLKIRIVGLILLCLSAVFILPIITSLIYHEDNILKWIAYTIGFFSIACSLLFFSKSENFIIFHRDAILIVIMSWVTVILIGSLPYILFLDKCSLINALFESTSGYTSTGYSIFRNIEEFPKSLLIYRALTQWIGGLGIIVLFTFLLPFLGSNTKKLYSYETSFLDNELTAYSVKKISYNVFIIYTILTLSCVFTFYFFGMSAFDAICHAFTTVSTGGLSNYSDGFAHFDSPELKISAIVFMITGGVNFQVIAAILFFKHSFFKKNEETKFFLKIILVSVILISVINFLNGINISILDNIFQVASTITTTGFSVKNYNFFPSATCIIFITVMLFGGCTGSTAGGIKIARLIVIKKTILMQIEQMFHPHIIRTLKLNQENIEKSSVITQLSFVHLYLILILISIVLMSCIHPEINLKDICSIIISSSSNSGIIFTEIDITNISDISKVLLSVIMLLGRLEIYPILCLFTKTFWGTYKKINKH